MHRLKSNSGFTLTEVITAVSVMTCVLGCTVLMMITSMHTFDKATTKAYTDTDAIMAMNRIVNDVREATQVKIIGGGTRLRVIFPKVDGSAYDRHVPDTAHQVDYYLSDSTGVPGQSGTNLWRGKDNNSRVELLKSNVINLNFSRDAEDTECSVQITIVAQNKTAKGPITTQLTQRVVYLRNFSKG